MVYMALYPFANIPRLGDDENGGGSDGGPDTGIAVRTKPKTKKHPNGEAKRRKK